VATTDAKGRGAELAAGLLLQLKGFSILARRYRSPVGEIDIVARRGRLLVFVEVKRRAATVAALEAVGARQRRRIARAAEHFLRQRPALAGLDCRFDVVACPPWRLPHHLADAWRP
jgi:putative endonuclease